MSRNSSGPHTSVRKRGVGRGKQSSPGARTGDDGAAARLRHVDEYSLGTMHPGDIILMAEAKTLRHAVESVFFALLACPVCGTLGLITAAQYFGNLPVTCASELCSCRFRIREQSRMSYLPVE